MPIVYEGSQDAQGCQLAVVTSQFNRFITDALLEGALQAMDQAGVVRKDVSIYRCPGAFELPQLLTRVLKKGGVDGVVCLGAVIRGGTPHFDYIAGAVTQGIAEIARRAPVPISFGVLTTDTVEQAVERAGADSNNKGREAAMATIEMVNLYRSLAALGEQR